MKNECQLINDLLPLYEEKMLSEYSENIVREHLETCSDCAEKLSAMNLSETDIKPVDSKTDQNSRSKRIFTLFQGHFILIIIAAIAVQLMGEIFYYKYIEVKGYGYLRAFLIGIYFFLPVLSFLISIKITKQREVWKIGLQQFCLLLAVNVYQIIYCAVYMNTLQIKLALDIYVPGLPVLALYATVPVLAGLVIESLYKWIRGKMMKIEM